MRRRSVMYRSFPNGVESGVDSLDTLGTSQIQRYKGNRILVTAVGECAVHLHEKRKGPTGRMRGMAGGIVTIKAYSKHFQNLFHHPFPLKVWVIKEGALTLRHFIHLTLPSFLHFDRA